MKTKQSVTAYYLDGKPLPPFDDYLDMSTQVGRDASDILHNSYIRLRNSGGSEDAVRILSKLRDELIEEGERTGDRHLHNHQSMFRYRYKILNGDLDFEF